MRTSCEKCEFKVGHPQTGCRLGFLQQYMRQGAAEASEGHFVINGRLCPGCYRADATWPASVVTPEDKERQALKLARDSLPVKVVIPVGADTPAVAITRSLASASFPSDDKPYAVSVVYREGTLDASLISSALAVFCGHVLWNLRCIPRDAEGGAWRHVYEEFVACLPPTETHWVLCEPGRELPPDYLEKFYELTINRLEHLYFAEPAGPGFHGTVCSVAAYSAYAMEQQLVTADALRAEGVPVHQSWIA